jgi:hypothetical protein
LIKGKLYGIWHLDETNCSMPEVTMSFPQEFYQMETAIAEKLPDLRPAQHTGLALWVCGTILAHSSCQNAVVSALTEYSNVHTLRAYLREWLYDGSDKAARCKTQVEVTCCFPRLLSWVLSLWQSKEIALAFDACALQDRVVALVVSVLYEGCAIPVAWHILPANQKGSWTEPIITMFDQLAPAIAEDMHVLVMADRGLWSRRFWRAIQKHHWHPMMRVQNDIWFRPTGQSHTKAATLVRNPQETSMGEAWVGEGIAFSDSHGGLPATLVVYWGEGQKEPWMVLTDLPAREVGACWYRLRMWIELGFRVLKGLGWQWNRTRRTNTNRVARHWLVLAITALLSLACGTRVEQAMHHNMPAHRLRSARKIEGDYKRMFSVFRLGVEALARQLLRGRLWRCLWLSPQPWPSIHPCVKVTYHSPP